MIYEPIVYPKVLSAIYLSCLPLLVFQTQLRNVSDGEWQEVHMTKHDNPFLDCNKTLFIIPQSVA